MDNNKIKGKISSGVIPFLLLINAILPIIFGTLTHLHNWEFVKLAGHIAAGVILLFVLINGIAALILSRYKINFSKLREKLLNQKDEMLRNYNKHYHRIKLLSLLSNIYFVLFFITVPIFNVFFLSVILGMQLVVIKVLLSMLAFVILIYELFFLSMLCVKTDEVFPESYMLLEEQTYPGIWEITKAEMLKANLQKEIVILAVTGCNAGVAKRRGGYYELIIGVEALSLLSAEELSTILKHEFMHIKNKETELSFKLHEKHTKWTFLSQGTKLFPSFLFAPFSYVLNMQFESFLLLISHDLEVKADSCFSSVEKQIAVNAIAKFNLFELNSFFAINDLNYFDREDFPENIVAVQLDRFKKCYQDNKETWHKLCVSQLASKLDTHPNLAERMKIFGVSSFNISFENNASVLEGEIAKIQKEYSDFFKRQSNWTEEKNLNFTMPKNYIYSYEKNPLDFSNLHETAYNYYMLGNLQKAEELYKEILNSDPNNPDALFNYGFLLSHRLDDNCIDYLIKCIDYYAFSNMAIALLTAYITIRGNEEAREKYRDIINDNVSEFFDFIGKGLIRAQTPFIETLQKKALKDFLTKESNILSAIIVGRKTKNKKGDILFISLPKNISYSNASLTKRKLLWFLSDNCKDVALELAHGNTYKKLLRNGNYCLKNTEESAHG